MRSSKAADHRRRIAERPYSPRLLRLHFENVPALGSGTLEFATGVTIVCGLNGVGKTTLLNCIFAGLVPLDRVNPFRGPSLVGAKVSAEIVIDGSSRTLATDEERTAAGVVVITINAGEQGRILARDFADDSNLDDLLEPLSPQEAGAADLIELSYLVGKDYSRCETFEIEEYEEVLPYFRVTAGGATYGSEHMGAGELALHLIRWHLLRAPRNSILLFEEPEQYASPHSQAAIVDVLARVSSQRSVFTIITSHAPGVVNALPLAHVRLLSRSGGGVNVHGRPKRHALDLVLGVPHKPRGVVLVEDIVAKAFAVAWLRRVEPEILDDFEIVAVGGESRIASALQFPRSEAFAIVGLFDGDQRKRAVSAQERWPAVFLPGDISPDHMLRQTVQRRRSEVAAALGARAEALDLHTSVLSGCDDHDYVERLRTALHVSLEGFVDAVVGVWMVTDPGRDASEQALAALLQALRPPEEPNQHHPLH